jgi:hypothetical protein
VALHGWTFPWRPSRRLPVPRWCEPTRMPARRLRETLPLSRTDRLRGWRANQLLRRYWVAGTEGLRLAAKTDGQKGVDRGPPCRRRRSRRGPEGPPRRHPGPRRRAGHSRTDDVLVPRIPEPRGLVTGAGPRQVLPPELKPGAGRASERSAERTGSEPHDGIPPVAPAQRDQTATADSGKGDRRPRSSRIREGSLRFPWARPGPSSKMVRHGREPCLTCREGGELWVATALRRVSPETNRAEGRQPWNSPSLS